MLTLTSLGLRRGSISLLLLLACGRPNDNPAAERVRLVLTRMPTCLSADDDALTVTWACSQVQCDAACCNTCTLREVRVGMEPIDLQRAREVLDLDADASDCDASAIRDVLQNVRMSFRDATCLRRG